MTSCFFILRPVSLIEFLFSFSISWYPFPLISLLWSYSPSAVFLSVPLAVLNMHCFSYTFFLVNSSLIFVFSCDFLCFLVCILFSVASVCSLFHFLYIISLLSFSFFLFSFFLHSLFSFASSLFLFSFHYWGVIFLLPLSILFRLLFCSCLHFFFIQTCRSFRCFMFHSAHPRHLAWSLWEMTIFTCGRIRMFMIPRRTRKSGRE